MFNNPFLKKDPLLEAVKNAQMDGECRRQAEKIVNEEFGVYSRKAVVREHLAAYDAALESTYLELKEGNKQNKEKKKEHEEKAGFEHIKKMGGFPGQSLKRTARGLTKEELAKRDYDDDGKIESEKDEVWGSRFKAAKAAGKMEEGNVTLKDVRDADAAQNPSGLAAQRNKSEDDALERAGKGLAKDIKEKKMWEGSEDTPSNIPPSSAAQQAAKQTPTPASTPKKTSTSDLSSTFSSARGATGMQEEKWIQAALAKKKSKGALHKDLNVSQKKKIPLSKLKAASDDPGKTGKRARLAMTLRKLHEKLESDSFKAAQETGKSVNEAIDAVPSWVNQPAPGIQKAARPGVQRLQGAKFYRGMSSSTSGQGTAKFLPQTSVKATGPAPKTGTSLVPSGNRTPAIASNKLPVPAGSRNVTAASAGGPKPAGSGFTYSRGPSTPGVNPPHPSEKIGGFGNFKPASSGGGLSAMSKGIGSAVAKVARFAANPVVGGVAAAMDPTPANQGENEFARQAKYGQQKPAEAPKPAAPAAAKPASPVKQSFSQAYKAARDAATTAKQDPDKAQFNWTNKQGKEGTYQAASTKKDYVPASKQFKTNVGQTAAPSTQASEPAKASTDTSAASAPTPPSRPADLTPTSSSPIGMPGSEANPDTKFRMPKSMTGGAYQQVAPKYQPMKMPDEMKKAAPVQEENNEKDEKVKAPKPMMTTFSPSAPMGNIPKMSDHPPSSLKEEVTVGNNKYRIV